MDGRPPWEIPLLGGPGILDAGKDRKSNAEITPLEVPRTAIQLMHMLSYCARIHMYVSCHLRF